MDLLEGHHVLQAVKSSLSNGESEDDGLIIIGLGSTALAAGLMLINVGVTVWLRLSLGTDLLVAMVRGAAQLISMGYFLNYVFVQNNAGVVTVLGVVMLTLAAVESAAKTEYHYKGLFYASWAGIAFGTCSVLAYMVFIIIYDLDDKYSARYIIPILGIQLGNAMSAAALGVDKCLSEFVENKLTIEIMLALGATKWEACGKILSNSVRVGLMMVLNNMSVVGIVFIPGMMSGQVLAGVAPDAAARYQISILYVLAASSFLAVTITCALCIKHLFLPEGVVQWHLILKRKKSKMDVLRVLAFAIYNAAKLLAYKCRSRSSSDRNLRADRADANKPKRHLDAHNIDYFSSATRHGSAERELFSDSECTSSGTSSGTSEGTSDSDTDAGREEGDGSNVSGEVAPMRRRRRARRKTKFASGAPGEHPSIARRRFLRRQLAQAAASPSSPMVAAAESSIKPASGGDSPRDIDESSSKPSSGEVEAIPSSSRLMPSRAPRRAKYQKLEKSSIELA